MELPFKKPPPPDNPEDLNPPAWVPSTPLDPVHPSKIEDALKDAKAEAHVIDGLVRSADDKLADLLKKETKGIEAAAEAYRKRRGREPPPQFDEWVQFAEENHAVMVEDLFDQIYDDLNPFWALNPKTMRDAVLAWPHFISVRGGNVTLRTPQDRDLMRLRANMVARIAHLLPDIDLALNDMDETRLLVPWESINHYMEVAEDRRKKNPLPTDKSLIITEYPTREPPLYSPELYQHGMITNAPVWSLVQQSCSPSTPGRDAPFTMDFDEPPSFPKGWPNGSTNGFVSNWTYAKDPCVHAHLRGLHGSFVEPLSMSTSQQLFPLFADTKLPMNNEIMLPAAAYWTNKEIYQGGDKHLEWTEKSDGLVWRGVASGGRNRLPTWARFHRHRFVSMMNGTHVRAAQSQNAHENDPDNYPALKKDIWMYDFPLPNPEDYPVKAIEDGHLGAWIDSFADAGFLELWCYPREQEPNCSYTSPFFKHASMIPMKEQYRLKYLPDIDGNSFSGRYRGFLRSNSVPIKATVYSEWHDSRLIPWKHFVPMDNTFKDFWGIMQYFLGYKPASYEKAEEETGWVNDSTKTKSSTSESSKANSTLQQDTEPADDHTLAAAEEQMVDEASTASTDDAPDLGTTLSSENNAIPNQMQHDTPPADDTSFDEEVQNDSASVNDNITPAFPAVGGSLLDDPVAADPFAPPPDTQDSVTVDDDSIPAFPAVGDSLLDTPTNTDPLASPPGSIGRRQLVPSTMTSTSTSTKSKTKTEIPGHDAVARHIAESGHQWAERVLRKDDMLIYVYRLLLEYARICSEDRDRMAWVPMAYQEPLDPFAEDGH